MDPVPRCSITQNVGAETQVNNASGGLLNASQGNGNAFPGATFQGPVFFNHGSKEESDTARECLRSLYFPEMNDRVESISDAATGTCDWILEHEIYSKWTDGLLWIKGPPGSGKSTLLRRVIEHARTHFQKPIVLSFFFSKHGTARQRTSLGLFRSLLYQLGGSPSALSDVFDAFKQRCEELGKPEKAWYWTEREIRDYFRASLVKVLKSRPLWLFVDALDECDEDEGRRVFKWFESLVQMLLSALPSESNKLRICFTSRIYPNLGDSALEIHVHKENENDIRRFLVEQLSPLDQPMRCAVINHIMKRVNGIFLWAQLVVRWLLQKRSRGRDLWDETAEIARGPSLVDFNHVYEELIKTMDWVSHRLMLWVCLATRPLTLQEVYHAMLIETSDDTRLSFEYDLRNSLTSSREEMERRVLALSRGLIEVTPESSDRMNVQLIHHTVKDFVVSHGLYTLESKHGIPRGNLEGKAHYHLAKICIRYLTTGGPARTHVRDSRSAGPLLGYAIESWVVHAKQSELRGVAIDNLLNRSSEAFIQSWARLYHELAPNQSDCPPDRSRMLHIVSRHALLGPLRALLHEAGWAGNDLDAQDATGRTPLSHAAEKGHTSAAELLLGMGETGFAKFLIDFGRLLVGLGVDIDSEDRDGRTPLSWAASGGHEDVVQLLLTHGTNVNQKDKRGWSPLSFANENRHHGVGRLLRERGARPVARTRHLSPSGAQSGRGCPPARTLGTANWPMGGGLGVVALTWG